MSIFQSYNPLLGKLFIGVLAMVVFSTCRINEDINSTLLLSKTKKINKIEAYFEEKNESGYPEKQILNYEINEQGNLIKVAGMIPDFDGSFTFSINENNMITDMNGVSDFADDSIRFVYNSQRLLIQSYTKIRVQFSTFPSNEDITTLYYYNSKQQLIKSQSRGVWTNTVKSYEYDSEKNMVYRKTNSYFHSTHIWEEKTTYDNKINPFFQKFNPFFFLSSCLREDNISIHSLSSHNPIETRFFIDNKLIRTITYSYEYDQKGYPVTIKVTSDYNYNEEARSRYVYKITYN